MSDYRCCITEYDREKNLAFERAEGFAEGFCTGLEESLNEQPCWRETEDKAAFLREMEHRSGYGHVDGRITEEIVRVIEDFYRRKDFEEIR